MQPKQSIEKLFPGISIKEYSSKRCAVLTDDGREEWFLKLEKELKGKWDRTPDSRSSMGWVIYGDDLRVTVKPLSKQGRKAPGMENEDIFVQELNNLL